MVPSTKQRSVAAISDLPEAAIRLLEAAEKLFAERGFADTSIRDLAEAAGVNVAAVNYYFGDKDRLYLEALRRALRHQRTSDPPFEAVLEEARREGTPAAAARGLRKYIGLYMGWLFAEESEKGGPCACALFQREMSSPTPALDVIVEEFIEPKSTVLWGLLQQARPELGSDREQLLFHAASIVGQCLHYRLVLPVILRLHKKDNFSQEEIRRIAEHIANFTLRGLGLSEAAGQEKG
ncbi:MAG: CerR family C-terminal domain-containing protein [Candidatus Acidiferrales bacterium]